MQPATADCPEDHEISAYLKRLMVENNMDTILDKDLAAVVGNESATGVTRGVEH
jgi:hypothetical protein